MFERLVQEHHQMIGEREEKEGRRVKGGSPYSLSMREQNQTLAYRLLFQNCQKIREYIFFV